MTRFATVPTDGSPTQALRRLLARLLDEGIVRAVLVPTRQAPSAVVMQTLVSDPRDLEYAEPLAPVAWTNAGTLVSSLTQNPTGAPIAAVLRSCEVRAFVERTKLNQGTRDNLLLIGIDCLGRFENRDYLALADLYEDVAGVFLRHTPRAEPLHGFTIARACRACEYPVAPNVDLRFCLLGQDPFAEVLVEGATPAGGAVLDSLLLPPAPEPTDRKPSIDTLVAERTAYRDALLAAHRARTRTVDGLVAATAACINCYNCRVACPLCYCRECVFSTDLFRHDSAKYLAWAGKRGSVRMPTDTLFYHLTRMVHMSTLCVGCGQCSSACPNGIDVMEMFRSTAAATQARFGYVPGRAYEDKQPMATFQEDELGDATGQDA